MPDIRKILVVDDDTDILELLKYFFTLKGFDTKVSTSCDEGLSTFYSFSPDVVLLDINVGAADGRIMCRTIKTHADYQHIPVILISANADNLATYSEYGADDRVEKPFSLDHLQSRVEAAILTSNSASQP
jgi:DNA-binding response OmpR family regulator